MKILNKNWSFRSQFQICKKDGMVGSGEGDEFTMEMAIPSKKFIEFVKKNGTPPKLKMCSCKRFGGNCSSSNCRENFKISN